MYKSILKAVAVSAVAAFFCVGCGGGGNPVDPNNPNNGGGGDKSVWLLSNQKSYTLSVVTGGVIGIDSSETNYTWISYTDDKNYEQQSNSTSPYYTYTEYDAYTTSYIGSAQSSYRSSRNGNTEQTVQHNIRDYTTTVDYKDPARENYITRTTSDIITTVTVVYDEGSGLPLSMTSTVTGTQNDVPINLSIEDNYTIVPLSTQGDVKTYKSTNIKTSAYTEYKVQNGVTLEAKSYSAEGTLSSTMTYTFPDNATIRAKLPKLVIVSAGSINQTCELVSDSATELIISIKSYVNGSLYVRQENTYKKR